MSQGDIIGIGALLVALGGAFWLATQFLLRAAPVGQLAGALPFMPAPVMGTEQHEAMLMVQPGWRVLQLNTPARELFGLKENDLPNLDHISRRIRPGEKFLELCSAEGQAQLVIEGSIFAVSSYWVGVATQPVMLIVLRQAESEAGISKTPVPASERNFQLITQITQEIGRSLELDATLWAIQRSVDQILQADLIEICLWEPEVEHLVAYTFVGSESTERTLDAAKIRYRPGESYAGMLARDRQPLLVTDLARRMDLRLSGRRGTETLQSLVAVPLLVQNNLVGTLAAASLSEGAFSASDLNLLQLLAKPAEVALSNARRFRDEQRRSAELSGLAQLAQGFGSARDPQTLFSRLVDSIAPLIPVDILGFLIFNESTRTLQGQEPIRGLPPQFVEIYRVSVLPNSPAEQMLLNQDLIITELAVESPEWEALGLGSLARAASLKDTVLVPLTSGGRMLGYLQASNHHDGSQAFTQDEIHLLTIVANQAAPVIENVTLVMQARQRVQRAEVLRKIAALATSAATLDEILKYALQELSHLLQADLAFIFLLNQDRSVLRLHQASLYGRLEIIPGLRYMLAGDDPQFHFTFTGSSHSLSTPNINEEKTIIPFYQQLTQAWQVVSAVAVPLVVRDAGVGEIWLGSRRMAAFDTGDLQVVATAAGQLAAVVEQGVLSVQTDESLRRRVDQLTALMRVSRELNSSRDLKALLNTVYAEALNITGVVCGTILLLDQAQPADAALQVLYSTGDAPSEFGEPELTALRSGEPVHIPALELAALPQPHTGVVSLLVVPIRFQARPVGLIVLHGRAVDSFDPDVVAVVQALAAHTALALEDAYLYRGKQLRDEWLRRQETLVERLRRLSDVLRSSRSLPDVLEEVAASIRAATVFQVVVVSLYESRLEILRRVVGAGLEEAAWEELRSRTQPWISLQALFQPQFKIGDCYYIPADQTPLVPADVHFITVLAADPAGTRVEKNAWNADDLLLIPLYSQEGQPLGLISLDAPADNLKPDQTTLATVAVLASQAGLAIETWQQISERDSRLAMIEMEQKRLVESAGQARMQTPMFLRHDLEQTIVIHALNRQMERVLAGLEIAETANHQPDSLSVLRSLARDLLTRLDLQTAMIAENTPSGIRLLDVLGVVPAHANPEALFGQRNPLRQMLQDGHLVLVSELDEKSEWRGTPLLAAMGARSFVALPIEIEANRYGGVLAMGIHSMSPFSDEDRQIYAQLSRQVSLGTQHLSLLAETQRRLHEMDLLLEFSRKLGLLDPRGILAALIETVRNVLPSGDAGWVAIWEEGRGLTPQVASGYSDNSEMLSIHYTMGERNAPQSLPLRAYNSGFPMRVDVAFAQDYSLPAEDLLHYRKATGGRLPVSTMIIPIGRAGRVLGVLVMDHFSLSAAFSLEDESLASSLAQQCALALENARLFVSAEQRSAQLQALNQVSGALTSSLQQGELVSVLIEQLHLVLPFETATLWLRKENTLSVAAASGFEDNESRQGISVAVQDSALFKEMAETGHPLWVPDVRQDARFPSFIEPEHLAWLGIPLVAKAELIGVIALEKHEAGFYTPDQLQSASTFASQAGVALENARLFEESTRRTLELDERTQRLVLLNRLSSELGSTLNEQAILNATCQQLHSALGANRVSALMIGEGENSLSVLAEVPAGPELLPIQVPNAPLLDRLRESKGIFSTFDLANEADLSPLVRAYFSSREAQSVLFVPLVTAVNLPGWLLIQTSAPYRFNPSEIELARTMGNQAAVALQNARLYNEMRLLTQELERRVEERTRDVVREHNNTQALLTIITELSSSLDLELVMNRTLQVLMENLSAEQSVILLNSGKTYQAGMDMIAHDGSGAPRKGSLEREISRWVSRRRVSALVDNVLEDARWKATIQAGEPPVYRSLIAVPLILGEEVSGALLLIHRQPGAFMIEQVTMVEATARQFGVALNNAELFTLIRDQAENLGGLLREQQIEASRSRAILESVADGVVVTDQNMQITLFNASAERILETKASDALGKSLESFAGLFGSAEPAWHQTIVRWSESGREHLAGETFAEQINLDSGRVLAVNLAPVFFRGRFQATVSIFRDITHEIQVDRLKSEFVANVSHELRTPMTSIKGYVEIMLMGAAGELSPQQRHFLEIVKGNTERLKILVNDLLDVSKIEAGGVVLSLQAVDLTEIIAEVINDIQRRGRQEGKSIKFQADLEPGVPNVMGDAVRIRQVLANLVTNGYNYTPENGSVTVRLRSKGNEVLVEVVDTGIGIASKDQARIFERFYRGEDPLVLATAGTGLGLAISKILVEMHHGQIGFSSSGVRGEGSTFYFSLPVAHNEE